MGGGQPAVGRRETSEENLNFPTRRGVFKKEHETTRSSTLPPPHEPQHGVFAVRSRRAVAQLTRYRRWCSRLARTRTTRTITDQQHDVLDTVAACAADRPMGCTGLAREPFQRQRDARRAQPAAPVRLGHVGRITTIVRDAAARRSDRDALRVWRNDASRLFSRRVYDCV